MQKGECVELVIRWIKACRTFRNVLTAVCSLLSFFTNEVFVFSSLILFLEHRITGNATRGSCVANGKQSTVFSLHILRMHVKISISVLLRWFW